ncbi:Hypothetical predicted protein [Mytilus galloprovincialis]|uniref:C-type lectin domain-containing protein n=1 Tax=Mytilus galloprovincialis TaxID=29158 RepID=A0A8B6CUE7_MYTGA|nr:Hypothetical predicted protein [Mytilus galloprovincialis]
MPRLQWYLWGKNVPCNETFGPEWTYNGKCCNERPCCRFLKAPCVPETCPNRFKLLSNPTSSANCYSKSKPGGWARWNEALVTNYETVWTGANDIDKDGKYTFAFENSPFSLKHLPFGEVSVTHKPPCAVRIQKGRSNIDWYWESVACREQYSIHYICEYKLTVCP